MKLVHEEWRQSIEFPDGGIRVLQIEDATYFSKVIQEFIDQSKTGEGKFVLSDGDKILDFTQTVDFIFSPFVLNFENKKFITGIVKQLQEIAQEEEYMETQNISGEVFRYLYRLLDYMDVDVKLNDELDIQQLLLKVAGLHLVRDEGNLLECLTEYLFLSHKLLNTKLIVGVNFETYFSDDQLALLENTVIYGKISLLLLENKAKYGIINKWTGLIIDKDFCEI